VAAHLPALPVVQVLAFLSAMAALDVAGITVVGDY